MKNYKSLRPKDIKERIAKTLYAVTAGPKTGFFGPVKPVYDILEAEEKEHWQAQTEETICLFTNVLLNIGPANLLHVIADRIWEDDDKPKAKQFHDYANLLDEKQ